MPITLTRAREKKKLRIDELANLAGIAVSTVYRLENGTMQPRYSTIVALEKALELKHGSLVFEAEPVKVAS